MLAQINEREFRQFRDLIHEIAGIHLSEAKKALVSGRLGRRLRHYGLDSFGDYFTLVTGGNHPDERQMMVDLLTTNETYFFREPKHFDFLRSHILPQFHAAPTLRLWSAASSSGEEAYSLAMVLADVRGSSGWEILGTDISSRVLEAARAGVYPLEDAAKIPRSYLSRYCLKGVRSQEGNLLIDRKLRDAVRFEPLNLNGHWPKMGPFHAVFLRNVMIYFNQETKGRLVNRIAERLAPGGYLIIGHSESLNGIAHPYQSVMPSVYRLK